jgi:gas vesicle protein
VHDHEGSVCLSSLVIGALAGAGLALLVAPRSGPVTRQVFTGKVREGADRARDVASRAKEKGRRLAEAAAERGCEAVERVAGEEGNAAAPASDYASIADYRGL